MDWRRTTRLLSLLILTQSYVHFSYTWKNSRRQKLPSLMNHVHRQEKQTCGRTPCASLSNNLPWTLTLLQSTGTLWLVENLPLQASTRSKDVFLSDHRRQLYLLALCLTKHVVTVPHTTQGETVARNQNQDFLLRHPRTWGNTMVVDESNSPCPPASVHTLRTATPCTTV